MDTLITYGIGGIICFFFLMIYLRSLKKREARAREAAEKGKLFSEGPKAQHPHIDSNYCIGCATCTSVCPEGDVLAMIGGKAVIVNGHKCIGHGLCADACPVGAITMVMASPSMAVDMPTLNPDYETTVSNLFIVGQPGGISHVRQVQEDAAVEREPAGVLGHDPQSLRLQCDHGRESRGRAERRSRYFHRDHRQQPISISRRDPGPGSCGRTAQARSQRGRPSQSHVPPDRG